jgi:hypothetical protein
MPSSSTLSLGQASYELLDALVTTSTNRDQTKTATVRAEFRGGVIDPGEVTVAFGNRSGDISTLNIADESFGLSILDGDLSPTTSYPNQTSYPNPTLPSAPAGGANARVNLMADAEQAQIALGQGDNKLFAAKDLLRSTVSAGLGDDTVRIGGSASYTELNLGGGDNSVLVAKDSEGLSVNVGDDDIHDAGSDTLLFLGSLTAAGYGFENTINTRGGDDFISFTGGLEGGDQGEYLVHAGAGDDTILFGSQKLSNNFDLDTGEGSDFIALGRGTGNADIGLGYGAGSDTLVLGLGADITASVIHSSQTGGDHLYLSGYVAESDFYLGNGGDFIGLYGAGVNSSFDLGYDDVMDIVELTDSFGSYDGITISNFGEEDILIIGNDSYRYNDFVGIDSESSLGMFLENLGGDQNRIVFKNGPFSI